MAQDPLRKKPGSGRPEIWASGGQRPPFDLRALWSGALFLTREGVASLHAWAARRTRRVAINVKNGAGRIPAGKLGRAERIVPSHLRVAGWIKNMAATLSHASATADLNVKRGNALVAEIEPHLWGNAEAPVMLQEAPPVPTTPERVAPDLNHPPDVPPVVLTEPEPTEPDPLASIREEMAGGRPSASAESRTRSQPAGPPTPPGAFATGAIQVSGYVLGWASIVVALPYGLTRALWLWLSGRDLKSIGRDD
jgi:hypothetical protein